MAEYKITEQNYEKEVLGADTPVLLDFWAEWCPPCRMLSPVIEQIAREYEGRVKVGKINVDEQPALSQAFNVTNIPLVVIMENGKIKTTSVGYKPKEQIEELLK